VPLYEPRGTLVRVARWKGTDCIGQPTPARAPGASIWPLSAAPIRVSLDPRAVFAPAPPRLPARLLRGRRNGRRLNPHSRTPGLQEGVPGGRCWSVGCDTNAAAQSIPPSRWSWRMDASEQVARAKSMYRRVLAQWAQDVLILRAKGLERPTWPRSSPVKGLGLVMPAGARRGNGVGGAHGKAA